MQNTALDFLYVDTNRIARLVAQMNDAGVVTEVLQEMTRSGEVSGGFKYLINWSSRYSRAGKNSRAYDPKWRLPVEFVNLTENAAEDALVPSAVIGDIVRLKGSLSLVDHCFMKEALMVPAISDLYNLADDKDSAANTSPETLKSHETLPNFLVATIRSGSINSWSTLNNACTTASTGDLILKCGAVIAGEWTLIGILDQVPSRADSKPPIPEPTAEAQLAALVRKRLGSPLDHYGITPLTIHRTVRWRYSVSK